MARQQSHKTQEQRRLTRAEMHAYYIAIVTMPRLTFDRASIEAHS